MKEQQYSSQILNDPRVQHRGAQFSFLNRMRPNENNDKENQEILDTRETNDPTELLKVQADKILQNLNMLAPPKFTRMEKIVNLIKESKNVVIDEKENFIVDGTATGINVSIFLYDLQQPTKKIDNPDYFKILEALNIKEDLVINSNAKIAIRKRTQRVTKQKKKKKTFAPKRIAHKETSQLLTEESSDAGSGFETSKEDRTQQEKDWESYDELEKIACVKIYENSWSIRKHKNLQKSTKLKPNKVKLFLEGKNAHTKRKNYRKRFPTLKVIAYNINEIWSLDLAYVDKLAKENKDVKYLLVAVDCLSRYLRVEPLKSKYATTTADAFKKR